MCITTSFFSSTLAPWTPVNITHVGNNNLDTATTHSYSIPSIIPDTAREVLFLAAVNCEATTASFNDHARFDVELNGIRYTQYVYLFSRAHNGVNTNSDITWLPMPSDRMVHIRAVVAFTNCHAGIDVIGYR